MTPILTIHVTHPEVFSRVMAAVCESIVMDDIIIRYNQDGLTLVHDPSEIPEAPPVEPESEAPPVAAFVSVVPDVWGGGNKMDDLLAIYDPKMTRKDMIVAATEQLGWAESTVIKWMKRLEQENRLPTFASAFGAQVPMEKRPFNPDRARMGAADAL